MPRLRLIPWFVVLGSLIMDSTEAAEALKPSTDHRPIDARMVATLPVSRRDRPGRSSRSHRTEEPSPI